MTGVITMILISITVRRAAIPCIPSLACSAIRFCVNKYKPYSITFQTKTKKISRNRRFYSIDINSKIFRKKNSNKLALVIECFQGEERISWYSFIINEHAKEIDKWEDVHFHYQIPNTLLEATGIKIYFWNQDDSNVFIDDFEVTYNDL